MNFRAGINTNQRQRKHPGARSNGVRPDRRDERRVQAQVRQAAHDKLTVEQKLAKLDAGGHAAVQERKRLRGEAKRSIDEAFSSLREIVSA